MLKVGMAQVEVDELPLEEELLPDPEEEPELFEPLINPELDEEEPPELDSEVEEELLVLDPEIEAETVKPVFEFSATVKDSVLVNEIEEELPEDEVEE